MIILPNGVGGVCHGGLTGPGGSYSSSIRVRAAWQLGWVRGERVDRVCSLEAKKSTKQTERPPEENKVRLISQECQS